MEERELEEKEEEGGGGVVGVAVRWMRVLGGGGVVGVGLGEGGGGEVLAGVLVVTWMRRRRVGGDGDGMGDDVVSDDASCRFKKAVKQSCCLAPF